MEKTNPQPHYCRGNPKLTAAQKEDIFQAYVQLKTNSERWGFESRMAEQYGVHRSTIHKITHDEKRMAKWLKGLNHAFDLASGQILANLGDAVKVQVDLIHDETLPPNMLGLKQNAAVDLMNRAGLKKKDEDANTMTIRFAAEGFSVGMPPASDGDTE